MWERKTPQKREGFRRIFITSNMTLSVSPKIVLPLSWECPRNGLMTMNLTNWIKKNLRETPIFHKYIFRRKKKIGEEKKDKTHNNDTNHIQVIDR